MPMILCSVNDKHIVYRDCCKDLHLCLLYNRQLKNNISIYQTMIDAIQEARNKLEDYCFPSHLKNKIIIISKQQQIVHLDTVYDGTVMEYANQALLTTAFANNSTIIRNLSIQKKHFEMALGISELVYCDFKPENVLLYQTLNDNSIPKIVDFGLSFQIATALTTLVKQSADTVDYDVSELIIDNKMPTKTSDIYALTFILYELLIVKCFLNGL
ncbi:unnamed protein product [Rotaria sp. Silwood2]|nr:unnamed protein product [Rotaria sp. Silwood2]CAF4577046.1 unnamed protein product [Rotaria sp. Silwood2]